MVVRRFIWLTMVRMWRTASTTLPEPRFALGANHRRTFRNAPERLTEIARATDEGHAEVVLPDVIFLVGWRQHSLSSMSPLRALAELRLQ